MIIELTLLCDLDLVAMVGETREHRRHTGSADPLLAALRNGDAVANQDVGYLY